MLCFDFTWLTLRGPNTRPRLNRLQNLTAVCRTQPQKCYAKGEMQDAHPVKPLRVEGILKGYPVTCAAAATCTAAALRLVTFSEVLPTNQ